MNYLETFQWLLSLYAGAILACQLAYGSTVIQKIKEFIGLGPSKSTRQWKWWIKPIVLLWDELRELWECPFCLSFWIGLAINLTLWDLTFGQSFIYALLSLAFVEVHMKLTR